MDKKFYLRGRTQRVGQKKPANKLQVLNIYNSLEFIAGVKYSDPWFPE